MGLHALWYVLAALMVIVGLAGTILPALPGLPLVFGGMLLAAWADGFERVAWWWLLVLGALTALSMVIDFWATAAGATQIGSASCRERVCQYVSFLVVAVYLKKKK